MTLKSPLALLPAKRIASRSKAYLSIANTSLEQVKNGYFPFSTASFEFNFPVVILTKSDRGTFFAQIFYLNNY